MIDSIFIKEQIDKIHTIEFVKSTSFIVEFKNDNKNIDIKPFHIKNFYEKNNKLQIEVIYSITDVQDVLKTIECKHSFLPKFLIKNKDKFDIGFYLLTNNLDVILYTNYKNCVLRSIRNPIYQYGNNGVSSVIFEFTYSQKINNAFDASGLDDLDRLTMQEVYNINKITKIKAYTDKLLDYALSSAEKHYNKTNDKKALAQVKSYIEEAKNDNKNKF